MSANGKSWPSSGSAGSAIEIVSIPWHFYASTYARLDNLFLPILSSAQRSGDLMGVRARDNKAALEAAACMAGELLRNPSFAPVRPSLSGSHDNYALDFVEDSFRVRASVYHGHSGKEAMFRVNVKGRIRGDAFVVSDSASDTILFSFSRFEAEKPEFFTREFPFLAQEARKEAIVSQHAKPGSPQETVDLMLGVPTRNAIVTVRIEKKPASNCAEIKSPVTGESIMTIPASALNNVSKAVKTIGDFLASSSDARARLASSSITIAREQPVEPSVSPEAKAPEAKGSEPRAADLVTVRGV